MLLYRQPFTKVFQLTQNLRRLWNEYKHLLPKRYRTNPDERKKFSRIGLEVDKAWNPRSVSFCQKLLPIGLYGVD